MPETTVFNRKHPGLLFGWVIACLLTAGPLQQHARASNLRRSAIVEAVGHARPSVVNIHGRKVVPAERDHYGASDSPHQVNGMGTGIIIDERGYVITNYHVVDGVSRIRVTLADESEVVGTLVANDPRTDLAVIKIPADRPLTVIQIGTSADLMPGETVVAMGNAFGYEHTVTQGIISALHRTVQVSDYQKYFDLIQTDASINPGNSGGPLLNIDGDMIGINVAVRVGAQGIGFAIPVDEALEVAAGLLDSEQVSGVTHGVVAKTEHDSSQSRVVVATTEDESPATKAGLKAGDIITRVANRPVRRRLDFERAVLGHSVGEEIPVEIERNGQSMKLSLVLDKANRARSTVADLAWSKLGLRLAPVSSTAFRTYRSRYRGGLKVSGVRADSPASEQGIRRGDVLVGLHKWETVSLDNIAYILNSAEFQATQPFKFYILRGNETLYGNMRVASKR